MKVRSTASPRRYSQLPRFFRWFSDHCVLREIDESDVARLVRVATHPNAAACSTVAPPTTHAGAHEMVLAARTHWMRGTRYTMAVLRKQTHDFVGWIEVMPRATKGEWQLEVFVHPQFAQQPIAVETVTAAADLMFSALGAASLYAGCPPEAERADALFNEAGFIELHAAGSPEAGSAKPRARSVLELGREDWITMRRAQSTQNADADMNVSNWVSSGLRDDLLLL
jgi:RimJ/RimL family protein N-acetyltransferase